MPNTLFHADSGDNLAGLGHFLAKFIDLLAKQALFLADANLFKPVTCSSVLQYRPNTLLLADSSDLLAELDHLLAKFAHLLAEPGIFLANRVTAPLYPYLQPHFLIL